MEFKPREHQQMIVDHITSRPASMVIAGMGLGKTSSTLASIQQLLLDGAIRGALIISPLRVTNLTWGNEVAKWDTFSWLVVANLRTEEGKRHWRNKTADVYLINYEQLMTRGGEGFCKEYLLGVKAENLPVDMVVWDECFPAGTRVETPSGYRNIEDIEENDCILNVQGEDYIIGTSKTKVNESIQIKVGGKTLTTTPNHPILTTEGWVKACEITTSTKIVSRTEALRTVQHVNVFDDKKSEEPLLQQILLSEMAHGESPFSVHTRNEEEHFQLKEEFSVIGQPRSIEGVKTRCGTPPLDEPSNRSQAKRDNETAGAQTKNSGRERANNASGTKNIVGRTWGGLVRGIRAINHYNKRRTPNKLQNRHSQPYHDGSHRSRWVKPPLAKWSSERCKEGQETFGTRVDSVEILKQGDPRMERFRDEDGFIYFYDLAVKRHPSFSVEGFVVHNCSKAKSPSSKRIKAFRPHCTKFKYHVGLTGTPTPNGYLDLFAQIRLLDQGKRLGIVFSKYQQEYFESDYMGYKWTAKKGSEEAIQKKISDMTITLRSEDYLDIPDVIVEDCCVNLPVKARKQYKELQKELLLELERGEIEAVNAAVLAGKLMQITGGAAYDLDKNWHDIHDAKLKELAKLRKARKAEGKNMLVIYYFKHELERISKMFPEAEKFTESRMDAWNRGEIPMMLANAQSIGHGLNLQEGAHHMVWFTLTYSRELYDQTNARLARTGQTEKTYISRILCNDTIDDAVAESLREKGETQSGLLLALKNLQTLNK